MQVLAMILAVLFFIVGLAGSVLPVIPGAVLIWLGMLIYGLLTQFATLSTAFFIGQGLAAALVYATDYLAAAYGVKRYGGSRYAVYGSVIGTMVGILLLGPAGVIFGPFIGAITGELLNQKPLDSAFKAGMGTVLGLLGGTLVKLAIQLTMIVWFFWAVYS
ncbi:DUF456 domain-containing protein [Desulfallas thermosapovorans]|uniref:DUF456 domain-containing protein n=1 Tax=Desulfallas thermosapovorans DSM 6562 TaxID=1121431 RepID=A0A5S4ZQA3_9FIRM|nr:DUF456 domain-containing protein [Desulfallas thermosapovorans]TYO94974.1 hypothetical protein LX24_01990 [Desulfallas thermosapovorans DSM 6562]